MIRQLTLLGAAMTVSAAAMAWQPSRPVEFVVTSGPGGGTDTFARTVQSIIAKHDLMDASIIVTNKGGGSGAEGFVYSAASKNDPYKLTFGTNNEYLLPEVGKMPYKASDLQPVAAMALDEFLIWVNGKAPYQSASDFIAAAKQQPGKLQFAGSQSKDTDQTLVSMIAEETGAEFRYVPFNGGSQALVQLAGGHVDANVNNPNENLGQWQAGMVKPLCVFSPEPLPRGEPVHDDKGWGDIPTCQSQGIPISEYRMPRTVWLPAGAPEEAVTFYRELLQKVSQTPEWQAYTEKTVQTSDFMSGKQLQQYIADNTAKVTKVFKQEGWSVN
ncbi:Bug family tripartite tricarboxylate transporter substrate binding protein [Kushneria phosphatilytica]|uniref:Tripartite tricarboxylate transporter substrate binding protein n=1 Tax=Kushneria phosphatilytica TaxID=657387 RepID=A0A1S1NTF5_9GAMM|nr:tripartite tricarboxylate transporter substrate binding protein [Kushneria phosphatilytica]OHV12844.1 tricarboxylate transporter [Kushneria phosphatilytica]QEL10692.1 tripartite tricarboxylate transporter substrate binding protein [Kushneria phosphatilytica]